MKIKNLELAVYSFYRFKKIKNLNKIKEQVDENLSNYKSLKGTLLIANEGINGSLAGIAHEASNAIHDIKIILNIRKLSLKINSCDFVPFYKLRTKIKREIVSMGVNNLNVSKQKGQYINAVDWNDVITDNTVTTIDVRNDYERKIGYFKNSKNIKMNSFREFPKIIKSLNLDKKSKIAMYCTGGIRCEKASSYLVDQGFENVMQLEGGIINYLNKNKNKKMWNGECFVFDNRISINSKLLKGKYKQCYGCRSPISEIETKSPMYIRGVSCPNCYNDKNDKQKNHSFKKIYLKDLS